MPDSIYVGQLVLQRLYTIKIRSASANPSRGQSVKGTLCKKTNSSEAIRIHLNVFQIVEFILIIGNTIFE